IASDDQVQFRRGTVFGLHVFQRVYCIRWTGSFQLEIVCLEIGIVSHCRRHQLVARPTVEKLILPVRWCGTGDEDHLLQSELISGAFGDEQMPVVNRVESSTKNSNLLQWYGPRLRRSHR